MAKKKKKLPWILATESLHLPRAVCVDPGLGGTGLAFWKVLAKPQIGRPPAPIDTAVLRATGKKEWTERVADIGDNFWVVIKEWKVLSCVFEFQSLWTDSATSMASAADGDLFKLTYLTGYLARVFQEFTGHSNTSYLVKPGEWKGQLSKGAIDRRIKRAIGMQYGNHIADAVGIGLQVMGVL